MLFRNELDLLEIRLNELQDIIDYFVIAESTFTFQGTPKPLILQDNWEKFNKWHNKIIYIKVDDVPNTSNAWDNEQWQRNAILRGLTDADPDDLIIISDVDEILRANVIADMKRNPRELYGFRTPYFNFKFNYMLVNDDESYFVWNTAAMYKNIGQPNDLRNKRFQFNRLPYEHDDGKIKIYEHAGWHFTYLGDTEWIKNKICSFSHTELNHEDILSNIDVEDMINRGVGFNPVDSKDFVKVNLDQYFPKFILDNKLRFQQYICECESHPISDFI